MSLDAAIHAFVRATRARGFDAAPFALDVGGPHVAITTSSPLSSPTLRAVQSEVFAALGHPVEIRLAREGGSR